MSGQTAVVRTTVKEALAMAEEWGADTVRAEEASLQAIHTVAREHGAESVKACEAAVAVVDSVWRHLLAAAEERFGPIPNR